MVRHVDDDAGTVLGEAGGQLFEAFDDDGGALRGRWGEGLWSSHR